MKQLSLITRKKFKGRKVARAIAIRRGENHVILKARLPVLRRHRYLVTRAIRETQDRFEVRLRAMAIMPDHIHLILRASSREQFANALRMLAGTIARRVNQLAKKKGAFWRSRAWSRVVTLGRDLSIATRYVAANPFKAGFTCSSDSYFIVNGFLQTGDTIALWL